MYIGITTHICDIATDFGIIILSIQKSNNSNAENELIDYKSLYILGILIQIMYRIISSVLIYKQENDKIKFCDFFCILFFVDIKKKKK